MQATQRKSLWAIRKRHVLKVCQLEHTVVRTVDSWSSTLTLSSPRNKVADHALQHRTVGITLRLQSTRLVAAVAELESFVADSTVSFAFQAKFLCFS